MQWEEAGAGEGGGAGGRGERGGVCCWFEGTRLFWQLLNLVAEPDHMHFVDFNVSSRLCSDCSKRIPPVQALNQLQHTAVN